MANTFNERLAQARAVGLPQSFDKVARHIEADVRHAALSTAKAMAQETGTYPKTVRRLTLRLGYSGWPELRQELATAVLQEADHITGTELAPRLRQRRQVLVEQRGALQGIIESLDAELAWIAQMLGRCRAQTEQGEKRQ